MVIAFTSYPENIRDRHYLHSSRLIFNMYLFVFVTKIIHIGIYIRQVSIYDSDSDSEEKI